MLFWHLHVSSVTHFIQEKQLFSSRACLNFHVIRSNSAFSLNCSELNRRDQSVNNGCELLNVPHSIGTDALKGTSMVSVSFFEYYLSFSYSLAPCLKATACD